MKEKRFIDLMKYNPKTDTIDPTLDLVNGNSEILKDIAGSVKEWAGNWDAVWENISLRAKIKELMVQYSEKAKMNELLESKFVVLSNDMFHKISDRINQEVGRTDARRILFEWEDWIKKEIKKRAF